MPRRALLSLIPTPSSQDDGAVGLTGPECDALRELALRPTYGLHHAPDIGVDAMLSNATAWLQTAEITSAANAGRIPPGLRREIVELLNEAIPESVLDLESSAESRDRWRAGDAGQGFPDLGAGETEAVYSELIGGEQRHAEALRSISAKLELTWDAPAL